MDFFKTSKILGLYFGLIFNIDSFLKNKFINCLNNLIILLNYKTINILQIRSFKGLEYIGDIGGN